MTWSKKNIIGEIKKSCFGIDINLPYWELRRKFTQARYTRSYLASGSFSFAHQMANKAPSDQSEFALKEQAQFEASTDSKEVRTVKE